MTEPRTTDPTVRTLRLLVLLQSRPTWQAVDLADRIGASPRTLRRDLQRLGELGYKVVGKSGPGGHYRLAPGTRMPPLAFDDDEAVALAIGLRMAEGGAGGEAAARALVKLRQVLPRPLAAVVGEVANASQVVDIDAGPDTAPGAGPSADDLALLSRASAGEAEVRFSYVDQRGRRTTRSADSVRCLYVRHRWSVLAFDHDREDWRLFLLERMGDLQVGGAGARREPPADDLAAWLLSDFGRTTPRP